MSSNFCEGGEIELAIGQAGLAAEVAGVGVGREEERLQGQLLQLDELLDVDVLEQGAGLVVHGRRQAQE